MIREFAEKNGITYSFLSDEGSRVIEALGVLDRHLEQHHAAHGAQTQPHQRGVAYPMTFVLDSDGRVSRKIVETSYRVRDSGPLLLAEVTGEHPLVQGAPVELKGDSVKIALALDTAAYRPAQRIGLVVRLEIAPGWHVYGPAEGPAYTPLSIRVESTPAGVVAAPIVWPAAKRFSVEALGEDFSGYEGSLELTVPLLFGVARDAGTVRLEVEVAYQACNESECLPPSALVGSLEVPQAPPVA